VAGATTGERATGPPAPSPAPAPRRERSAARDTTIREGLEPIGPGSRPLSLTIAAAVAAFIAGANLVAWAAGLEIRGSRPGLGGILVLTVLLGACAYGLFRARYWGVLGFEVVIALTVIYAALGLTVASNLAAVALCLSVIGLGGWLFWKLVRVMARIQMPTR
jgi:lysylphosphatidylglycerol synthetase-like protein (DUF2156 family)